MFSVLGKIHNKHHKEKEMYLHRKEVDKILSKFTASSVTELKEQSTFLLNLLREDDWSFVIKSHALLEAYVTQIIVDYIGDTRLKDFIERLPLSDSQNGKLVIAKQLGLLQEKERRFIRWFSELRNNIVHRIENINYNFKEHFNKLDKNQRKTWIETITCTIKNEPGIEDFRRFIEINPKVAIYITLFLIVSSCVVSSQQSKSLKEFDERAKETMKLLLEEFIKDEI